MATWTAFGPILVSGIMACTWKRLRRAPADVSENVCTMDVNYLEVPLHEFQSRTRSFFFPSHTSVPRHGPIELALIFVVKSSSLLKHLNT